MKIEKFEVIRRKYFDHTTVGIMLRNGEFFGYTLEDVTRDNNIKINNKTSIPAGTYELEVKHSPSKNRNRLWVKDVPGFSNIQIHGGNTHNDTSGCILVAKNINNDAIWGSLEKEITEIVEQCDLAFVTITNLNQL